MTDLLIYIPHGCEDEAWVDTILPKLKTPHPIARDLLVRYTKHEADRGALEVAAALEPLLQEALPNKTIQFIKTEVPRAWVDLNRPWEKAVPPILDSAPFLPIYEQEMHRATEAHAQAQYALHLHTMCGYSPTQNWSFTPQTTSEDLEHFLEHCYSGSERHIDLLTKNTDGQQVADERFASLILGAYRQEGYDIRENEAYSLPENYPGTQQLRQVKGCAIELPKHLLATRETEKNIDTSALVFDHDKIQAHARILAQAIGELLS